jgi:hypothetical protein
LEEKGSYDQFQRSFDKFLQKNPNIPNTEVVTVHNITLIVKDCLGADTPDFILYKFKELGFSTAANNELNWDGFRYDFTL